MTIAVNFLLNREIKRTLLFACLESFCNVECEIRAICFVSHAGK